MELERNIVTRKLFRRLLKLGDKLAGISFPQLRRVKQITSYHCGPAVLEALFSYLGYKISQRSVVRTLRAQKRIRRRGILVAEMGKAVKTLGKGKYQFWRKTGGKISDLVAILEKYKYPVGVEWQGVFYENEDEDNGHYGIITKVDKTAGYLRLADSYSEFAGIDRRFEIKYFEKRWWDDNEIKGRSIIDKRMMFVITPKKETWPRKFGMSKLP